MLQTFAIGLAAGLSAAPHCLGMCGCFPLHLARAGSRRALVSHQALYLAGKTLAYAFLGTLAGLAGLVLKQHLAVFNGVTLGISVVSGVILIGAGLNMLGLIRPRREQPACAKPGGLLGTFYAGLFRQPTASGAVTLGVLNGFLPCPITTGVLLLAANTGSPLHGAAMLTALGVGTAPVLLVVGFSGGFAGQRLKRFGLKPAGALLVLLGLVTLLRGTPWIHTLMGHGTAECCKSHAMHDD